jgi:hypothetical protein
LLERGMEIMKYSLENIFNLSYYRVYPLSLPTCNFRHV